MNSQKTTLAALGYCVNTTYKKQFPGITLCQSITTSLNYFIRQIFLFFLLVLLSLQVALSQTLDPPTILNEPIVCPGEVLDDPMLDFLRASCCSLEGYVDLTATCDHVAYGINNVTYELVGVDITDGSQTIVAALSGDVLPGEIFQSGQVVNGIYIAIGALSNNVYAIDINTGVVSTLSLACFAGDIITGLEKDPTTGILYAITLSGTIVQVDIENDGMCGIVSAMCTELGDIGGFFDVYDDIIINGVGDAFVIKPNLFIPAQIIPLDLTTITISGPPVSLGVFLVAGEYDFDCPIGGNLIYGYHFEGLNKTFVSIDPISGTTTTLGNLGFNTVSSFAFCEEAELAELRWYNAAMDGEIQAMGESFDPTGTTAEEGAFDIDVPGDYTYYAECRVRYTGTDCPMGFVDRTFDNPAEFSGEETYINFDDLPAGETILAGNEYAAEGLAISTTGPGPFAVTNNGYSPTPYPSLPNGLINFTNATAGGPYVPIRFTFDEIQNRAGFNFFSNAGTTTVTITCSLNGTVVGMETYPTGLSFTYLGIESATGFDQLDVSVAATNSAFRLDDLSFEGCYLVSERVPAVFTVMEVTPPDGISCQPINFSLNEIDCMGELTPEMVVTNENIVCLQNYVVTIETEYGDIVTELNGDLIGQNLTYKVCHPDLELCCWNTLTVEDYFPPEIMCEDVQVECNATDTAPVPEIISNDCGNTDLILLDSTAVQYDCHPTLSGLITKTWTARDKAGNEGNVCVQMIEVLRPVLAGINPPSNYIDNNALECKEFTPDENGNPTPGIDTDIPTIGMPPVPIWPITPDFLCNVSVRYVDNVLPGGGCATTIIRNWEIREWHCEGEEFISLPQMIQIRDTEGPTFEVPADYTVNVDMDFMEVGDVACKGKIFLPGVEHAYDNCNGIDRIDISSPHDFEKGDGLTGAELLLSVGDNLIEYIAYDSCYNETIQTVTVTVVDEREPVAICDTDPVVSLNSNGEGSLYAHDVDSGSYDECGPVTLLIAKMTDECGDDALVFDHHVSFCCEEVGVVMVVLQVTDAGGNTAQCMMEVTVDNKYQPSVIVPEDVTVDCTTPYDLDNLSQFGDIQVFGSCGGSAEDNGVSEINDCGEGKIIRTFIVTNNGGGTTTYQQTIYFENPSPFDGDDPAQLMFPEDYEDENICFNGNSKTQFPPSTTGEPVIVKDVCDLVGVSYEDEVLLVDNVLTACYKIRRTWSVVDWCQQENGVYLTWEAEQYIIISNDIAPEIETNVIEEAVDDEITIKTCEPQAVVATATGTMDCDEIAYWEYELIKDGMTVETGVSELGPGLTGQVTLMVDEGLYEIIWTMRDGCSNEDISRYAFEVINKKLPTPYAKEITVALDGTGEVEIWIVDIDNGSEHSCGYDFELSFGCDDVAVKSMTFTCDELGPNEVVLCATDELGNQNYVTTTVTVTEGSGSPCVTLLQADVVGQIISVQEELMGEVEVRLLGAELAPEMTNESGEYAFTDMPLGGSYVVDPYDNSNPLLGVSTLDLVMIQRHVLGTSSLTDPYQMIAADINGSEDITAIDLVELRKLILGIYAELPTNDSWRFVDANHEFTTEIDPWAFEIPEQYEILNLQGDMNIPFIGIKTGDVNFSGVLNAASGQPLELRSVQGIQVSAERTNGKLSLTTEDLNSMLGLQMELKYNGSAHDIISVQSELPGFDESNSFINHAEGTVSVSWHGSSEVVLHNTEIIYLEVTDQFDVQLLELTQQRIDAEAYEGNEVFTIHLSVENRVDTPANIEVSLYPNPWQTSCYVEITNMQSSNINYALFDISGRAVYNETRYLEAGKHTIEIAKDMSIESGIYHFYVSDGNTTTRHKLVKLD